MQAVEAASDVRPPERTNQPLADAIALEYRQRRVLRREFGAIVKLEAPHLQSVGLACAQTFEADIELFRKDHRAVPAVAVRRVVV